MLKTRGSVKLIINAADQVKNKRRPFPVSPHIIGHVSIYSPQMSESERFDIKASLERTRRAQHFFDKGKYRPKRRPMVDSNSYLE